MYRDLSPGFTPGPGNLVYTSTGTTWHDGVAQGYTYYYKVTATDFSHNESDPASAETVVGIGRATTPQRFALYQNHPNPFNPTTVIRYDVPAGGVRVTLRIFDVGGRLVRTLVNGNEGPGEKAVTWDGQDARGQPVASGVYFYQMVTKPYTKTRKMLLMK